MSNKFADDQSARSRSVSSKSRAREAVSLGMCRRPIRACEQAKRILLRAHTHRVHRNLWVYKCVYTCGLSHVYEVSYYIIHIPIRGRVAADEVSDSVIQSVLNLPFSFFFPCFLPPVLFVPVEFICIDSSIVVLYAAKQWDGFIEFICHLRSSKEVSRIVVRPAACVRIYTIYSFISRAVCRASVIVIQGQDRKSGMAVYFMILLYE